MSKSVFVVKTSGIHGKGLFASRDITEGEVIGCLTCQPAGESNHDDPYILWLDSHTAVRVECDLRYINHSDQPNACYYDDLEVVALRNIAAGEEITHHYGDDWR